ncbi:zinc-dependent alcohol dehydrogenase family protein [Aspergillus undulatus]|uniref:zinc-dependent alcohol dehydrogenase family protein n=1 Tax=Aspergillus undulatus TaxID=1810928 RepID=UPI003CCDCBED
MSTQTVLRLPQRDTWTRLTASSEAIPHANKHEVLVKVRSVSLNFRDIAIAISQYPFPVKENVIPGSDAAGDVFEIGEGVVDLEKGDKVVIAFDPSTLYGPIKSWGGGLGGPVDDVLREYISVPAHAVVKIPTASSLSYAQWASVVCTEATAWNSLYGPTPLRPGQTVLFQGTGGVSITGLILAKAAGAIKIITSSSDAKLEHVKKTYSVDHTINYKTTPAWAAEAQRITAGRGVDYILENGGSGTIKQSIVAIAYGGVISMIEFLSSAPQEEMPDVAGLALSKGAIVRGIMVATKQLLEEAVRFIGARDLQVPAEKTFRFDRGEVVRALDYLASGQHVGTVCIDF